MFTIHGQVMPVCLDRILRNSFFDSQVLQELINPVLIAHSASPPEVRPVPGSVTEMPFQNRSQSLLQSSSRGRQSSASSVRHIDPANESRCSPLTQAPLRRSRTS